MPVPLDLFDDAPKVRPKVPADLFGAPQDAASASTSRVPSDLFQTPKTPKIKGLISPLRPSTPAIAAEPVGLIPEPPEPRKPQPSFGDVVKAGFKTGQFTVERGKIGDQLKSGKINLEQSKAQLQSIQSKLPEQFEGLPLPKRSFKTVAEFLPFLIEGAKNSFKHGTLVSTGFGTAAAIAGQAGPQALTPEEILTVPGAALAGFGVGSTFGIMDFSRKIEGGNAFLDMLDAGVDANVAGPVSEGIGIINGLIEVSQIGTIVKRLPGGSAFFKKSVQDAILKNPTVRGKLVALGLDFTGAIASETGQEVGQEAVTLGGEMLAGVIEEVFKGKEYKGPDAQEVKDRILGTLKASAEGFPLLMLPGASFQTIRAFSNKATGEDVSSIEVTKDEVKEIEKGNIPESIKEGLEETNPEIAVVVDEKAKVEGGLSLDEAKTALKVDDTGSPIEGGLLSVVSTKGKKDASKTLGNNSDQTGVKNLKKRTIDVVDNLSKKHDLPITITGGTESGHKAGPISHASGDKLDLRLEQRLNKIVEGWESVEPRTNAKGELEKGFNDPDSTAIFWREIDHWDVEVLPDAETAPQTEAVPFADKKETIQDISDLLDSSEGPQTIRTEEGFKRLQSGWPTFLTNRGYTKKQLNNIFDKSLSGQPLTTKQTEILTSIIDDFESLSNAVEDEKASIDSDLLELRNQFPDITDQEILELQKDLEKEDIWDEERIQKAAEIFIIKKEGGRTSGEGVSAKEVKPEGEAIKGLKKKDDISETRPEAKAPKLKRSKQDKGVPQPIEGKRPFKDITTKEEQSQEPKPFQSIKTKRDINDAKEELGKIEGKPPTPTTLQQAHDGQFDLPEETRTEAFRRVVEDFNIRLKVLNNKIEEVSGQEIKESQDLWAQKDMLPRKQSDLIKRVRDEKIDFVKQVVADGISVEELDKYLHAKHAKERNAKMNKLRIERNKKPIEGLSGMTDIEAEGILNAAPESFKKYDAIVKKLSNDILNFEVDAGLVKEKDADIIRRAYENYVPLFRDVGDSGSGIGVGIDIRGKESKRAKGSKKRVISPIANIFHQKEKAQVRALKNEIGKSIIDMVEQHPFLEELFEVEKQQFIPRFSKEGEIKFLDPKFKLGDNVVGAKIEGAQYFITVNDAKIARALKNLNVARIPSFLSHFKTALGIWGSFKTRWRPEFLITNFERDLGEAIVNLGIEKGILGKEGKNIRRDVVKGIFKSQKEIWNHIRGKKKSVTVDEFLKLGGDTGHFWAENAKQSEKSLVQIEKELLNQGKEKILNPIRKAGQVIDDLNTMVELGVRFSAYKELLKRGFSKERAIQSVADLTVNFSRQGEISPFLKTFYGFINPTIQGSSKVIRSITKREGAAAFTNSVIRSVVALATLGFLIRVMSIMLDEEGDEQIAEWAKSHKVTFAIGGGRQVNLWSMPYGYSSFYSMGSNAAELMFKKKTFREATRDVTKATVDSFSPFGTNLFDLIPTLAKPIFEVNANKNWYDGKIFPDQVFTRTPKPNFETFFKNTSQTAIFTTSLLNKISGGREKKSGLVDIHPNTLEYLFNQYTGGPFEFIISSLEAGARGSKGEFDPNKTPFVRQVFRQGKPQSFSYKVIYDTLERAFKKDISEVEEQRFYRAIDVGRRANIFDNKRISTFIRDFLKAKYKIPGNITAPTGFKILKKMPDVDRKRLIGTYAESTQQRIKKKLSGKKGRIRGLRTRRRSRRLRRRR